MIYFSLGDAKTPRNAEAVWVGKAGPKFDSQGLVYHDNYVPL